MKMPKLPLNIVMLFGSVIMEADNLMEYLLQSRYFLSSGLLSEKTSRSMWMEV